MQSDSINKVAIWKRMNDDKLFYISQFNKNITYVIYSFMKIQDHTKSSAFIMIIKLNQHFIILGKSWMKKHNVSYHKHENSISFYLDYCSHLKTSKYSFFSQSTKKKVSFSKRNFSDQSEIRIERIENKEIKIFFEKINVSSKTILKQSSNQSIKSKMKRLNKRFKRLNEHCRIDKFWRKN
jgi:hypothetical protein